MAHFFLGQLAHWSGDYQRAKEHLRWNIDALTGNLVRERFGLSGLPPVLSRANLILVTAELGEFTEGAAYAERERPDRGVRRATLLPHRGVHGPGRPSSRQG